jgi:hypothetical protein
MINIDALNDEEKLAALESIHKSIAESKEIQKKKITTNVEMIVKALKKIEADLKQRYDETGSLIANLKNGTDGRDGRDGKDGKDGRAGKDGAMGPRGYDGLSGRNGLDGADGVSVTDAHIDFDGSLIIHLSSGRVINVGEVVAPDIAEKIKVITNGGGTSQTVIDALASLQAQITALSGFVSYEGTWNASTNTPTLVSSVGIKGEYYVVSTTGTTNLNGITAWTQGDWAIFNGTVWEKVDNTDLVTSVAGRTGAIVLTTADIGGLGTIATQNANSVSITGGSITGITDLAIADGGTGQSTANAAFNALAPSQTGNSGKYLTTNGTDTSWATNAAGDVVGPASATANGIVLFDGTTGKLIKNSASTDGLIQGMTVGLGVGSVTSNTALGKDVLAANTTGYSNVSVGYQALQNNTDGFENTALGYQVLRANTTGNLNSGVGFKALFKNTDGIFNNAFGYQALYENTSGDVSSAFGHFALGQNTIGNNNAAFGANALYSNTTASGNTAVGSAAAGFSLTATGLSALGFSALYNNTASYNTAIGSSALYSNTIGTYNTAIGYQSGYSITTGGKNVIIGGYTGLGAPISQTGSNYIVFSDGDANVRGYFSNSGVFNIANLTASKPVFTDASKNLVSTGTLGVDQGGTGLTTTPANGALDIGNGTGFTRTTLTAGTGVTITNASGSITINASGSGGTVTSVGGTGTVNGITLTGTVTTSGNLTLGGTLSGVSLTSQVTGTLPTANGGTNLTSFTSGGLVYASSSSALATGSNLTYDGTTTSFVSRLYNGSASSFGASSWAMSLGNGGVSANYFKGDTTYFQNSSGTQIAQLDSTGLGIGASSPTQKLDVVLSSATAYSSGVTGNGLRLYNSSTTTGQFVGITFNGEPTSGNGGLATIMGTTTGSGDMDLTFSTRGSATLAERARINSSGNMGIGTTSPAAKLNVSSTGDGYRALFDNTTNDNTLGIYSDSTDIRLVSLNNARSSYKRLGFQSNVMVFSASNGSESARIDSSGNLGVGITPAGWVTFKAVELTGGAIAGITTNQFDVVQNAYYDGAFKYKTTYGATYYQQTNSTHSWYNAPSGTAGNAITFTQAMTLSAAGNLGLGTTSPTGASGLTFAINGGAAQTRIALKNSTTGDATGDGFQIVLDSGSADVGFEQRENAAIRFITNNVEALRITNGQNVGIGTSSPSNKLSVSSSAGGNVASFTDTTTADLQINLTSGVSLLTPSTGILAFGTSSTERARIDSSGRFMVGTTSALNSGGAKASIQFAGGQGLFIATEAQGNGQVMGFNYNISTNVGSISITSTATAYNTSSDQRLKENIADANSASTLIDALQVRKFDWKADGSHQRYGFVAQELATVAPEAVYQPEDTEQMMAVDYSKLVPMLVKEIQSLRKRLADAGI